MKMGSAGLKKKLKESFLTALAATIKKEHTMSIRKYANELEIPREDWEDCN